MSEIKNIDVTKLPDHLLDRDCVMLDGACDCHREAGASFPFCKKYGTLQALDIRKEPQDGTQVPSEENNAPASF